MKRWQMTVGLAGLAIGALALAPRLFHHFPTPEPPPAPPEQPAPVPAVAAGHLVVDAHTDQGLYLRGDTTDHFVTIEVSAPADLGTGARRPVDLAVVLDTSGSMRDEIETAKAATLELARSLSPNDTLSVVAFAGQARVVRRAQGVASGPDLVDTLEGLYAHGGTNLFEGLELGGVTLARRPGALQRVVLLSDGKATEGELRPEAFARLASDLASRGTSVSTVGLGATYNEDLMARIADLGGGRYDDIAAGHELMSVFQEEVTRSATLIASDSRVTVTPKAWSRWSCSVGRARAWTAAGRCTSAMCTPASDARSSRASARRPWPREVRCTPWRTTKTPSRLEPPRAGTARRWR